MMYYASRVPDRLRSVLSEPEWETFCKTIDTITRGEDDGERNDCIITLCLVLGVVLLVIGLVKLGEALGKHFMIVGGSLVFFMGISAYIRFLEKKDHLLDDEEITKACERYSRRHPSVTIHYKKDRFEIFVTGLPPAPSAATYAVATPVPTTITSLATIAPEVSAPPTLAEAYAVASSAVAPDAITRTPADRIKELNKLKGLISEEQYEAKLQEILDMV